MENEKVMLFDANSIESLPWDNFKDGSEIKNFLIPLIKKGVSNYIDNVETVMMALTIGDTIFPITINNAEYNNSYVCSMYGQYISYALEAIDKIKKRWITFPLKVLVECLGKILRLGRVNKVVVVNNWLFSTNLYPQITPSEITAIRDFLSKKFADHAIVFKSVHTYQEKNFYNSLHQSGFNLIASRQIFLLDTQKDTIFSSRIHKSDMKLLNESGYEEIDISDSSCSDPERLTSLYKSIYLDKHSKLNPQLNTSYIQLLLSNKFLKLKGLRKDGNIDAIAGYYCINGTMMSPLIGYDVSRSPTEKLYRLVSTMLTLEAKKNKHLFHLSSGASFYKKIRKAECNMEFNAVYLRHLPVIRQFPWFVLKTIINNIGIPFMRYYNK